MKSHDHGMIILTKVRFNLQYLIWMTELDSDLDKDD